MSIVGVPLEDHEKEALRIRAKKNGRSMGQELKMMAYAFGKPSAAEASAATPTQTGGNGQDER